MDFQVDHPNVFELTIMPMSASDPIQADIEQYIVSEFSLREGCLIIPKQNLIYPLATIRWITYKTVPAPRKVVSGTT